MGGNDPVRADAGRTARRRAAAARDAVLRVGGAGRRGVEARDPGALNVNAPGTSRARRSSSRVVVAFLAVYLIWGSTISRSVSRSRRCRRSSWAACDSDRRSGGVRVGPPARRTLAFAPPLARDAAARRALLPRRERRRRVAEIRVSSGVASLLVATMPLWVVILDWLRPRGHRPHASVFWRPGPGFAGLAVLLPPSGFANGAAIDPLGALGARRGSVFLGDGSLYARRAELPKSLVMASGMEMIGGGALMTIAGLASGELARLTPRSLVRRARSSLSSISCSSA